MSEEVAELKKSMTSSLRRIGIAKAKYFRDAARYEALTGGNSMVAEAFAGKQKPKKEKKQQVKAKKVKPVEKTAFECKGNVVTGEACQAPEPKEQAASTLWNKQKHDTCKVCKKLIAKSKKA